MTTDQQEVTLDRIHERVEAPPLSAATPTPAGAGRVLSAEEKEIWRREMRCWRCVGGQLAVHDHTQLKCTSCGRSPDDPPPAPPKEKPAPAAKPAAPARPTDLARWKVGYAGCDPLHGGVGVLVGARGALLNEAVPDNQAVVEELVHAKMRQALASFKDGPQMSDYQRLREQHSAAVAEADQCYQQATALGGEIEAALAAGRDAEELEVRRQQLIDRQARLAERSLVLRRLAVQRQADVKPVLAVALRKAADSVQADLETAIRENHAALTEVMRPLLLRQLQLNEAATIIGNCNVSPNVNQLDGAVRAARRWGFILPDPPA